MSISASDILSVTQSVTKEWTKQRKAEERGSRSRNSRVYYYSGRVNFTDVAARILSGTYDHASGGGAYTVSKRQLYYACREAFKRETGRELEYNYFAGNLLVKYMNTHPETASWKVTADPRGTLTIPNAKHEVRIECGTLAIEDHLRSTMNSVDPMDFGIGDVAIEWPSLRHGQRYHAVLYIEKEGFAPILDEAKIAERFDLAVLSCKGQSVVAARKFVDRVCYVGGGVPLLVVHDFDKAGFEISARLTTVSDWVEESDRVAYRFRNKINVTDLGLRLADVEKYGLADEGCEFKGSASWADNSICTQEEYEFLKSGRRVELNAFTSPQLVEWLEAKLTEHGLNERLVPDDDVLHAAYRRALAVADINDVLKGAIGDATRMAEEAKIPDGLRKQLQESMQESPGTWDNVLYRIAKCKLAGGDA